jgi:hypothetical protein
MQTVVIDIINNKAINLLKDLELLQLIRLRRNNNDQEIKSNYLQHYKGAMSKQPIELIDQQLNELRNEWE